MLRRGRAPGPPQAAPGPAGQAPSSTSSLASLGVKLRPYDSNIGTLFRESGSEICGLFCFFLVIPLMFAFVYSWLPTIVVLTIFACFFAGLTPLCSGASFLSANLTASVIISTVAGLHAYHALLMPLGSLQHGRTYSGVYASQPSVAYSDAALLRFVANASVDTSKTLGMTTLEGGVATYCVAPVIDSQSTNRAEFWAIGLNCCGKLANFACEEAGVSGVHAAYVVEDARDTDVWFDIVGKHFTPSLYRRDLFMKAVKLAESVHGVASSAKPVMVGWSSKTRAGLVSRLWLRLVVFAIALVACALVAAVILSTSLKQAGAKMFAQAQRVDEELDEGLGPMDFQHVVIQGFLLPFVSFASLMLLTSWSHCFSFGGVFSAVVELAVGSVALAMLALRWSSKHGLLLILTSVIAVYIGHLNFVHNTYPYCSIQARRSYADVSPDLAATTVRDAGRLQFAQNSTVGATLSVGFRYRGVNYCAAPILAVSCAASSAASAGAPAPAPSAAGGAACSSSVWAVGVDCCQPRGGFSCGGVGSKGLVGPGPHAAVLHDIQEFGVHDNDRRNFLMAVSASASLHNLIVPPQPVLVKAAQNSGDLDGVVQEYKGTAIGVSLLALALAFLALMGVAFAWINVRGRQVQIPRVFRM